MWYKTTECEKESIKNERKRLNVRKREERVRKKA